MSNPLQRLNAAGQSVWFDHIHRGMLTGGELAALIAHDDLRGVTSNPSIFDKAITGGHDYDALIKQALHAQPTLSSRELFYTLAIEDIRAACDVLRPVYEKTDGVDGMVSLEVSPDLAHDAEATVREAHELRARLDRPNAMIKVPATVACLPAIEQLVADGFNINVTLLFAVERYAAVADAYLRGLERRVAQGLPVTRVESVASFFVSRVDAALDPLVAAQRPDLQGQLAVANAKLAYAHFQALYASERFAKLEQAGARPQRLLWASTSTKNPAYSDLLYVETLIGPATVNTLPPATYEAFRDHGTVAQTLTENLATAQAQIAALAALGIDLKAITDRLEAEGVAAFAKSFDNLLHHLAGKAAALTA